MGIKVEQAYSPHCVWWVPKPVFLNKKTELKAYSIEDFAIFSEKKMSLSEKFLMSPYQAKYKATKQAIERNNAWKMNVSDQKIAFNDLLLMILRKHIIDKRSVVISNI